MTRQHARHLLPSRRGEGRAICGYIGPRMAAWPDFVDCRRCARDRDRLFAAWGWTRLAPSEFWRGPWMVSQAGSAGWMLARNQCAHGRGVAFGIVGGPFLFKHEAFQLADELEREHEAFQLADQLERAMLQRAR